MMLPCVLSFPWLEMSTGEGHHRHQAWAMSSRGERLRQVGQPPGSPNYGSHGHLPILTPHPCGLAPVSAGLLWLVIPCYMLLPVACCLLTVSWGLHDLCPGLRACWLVGIQKRMTVALTSLGYQVQAKNHQSHIWLLP